MSDTPPTLPTTPARSPRPRRRRYVVAPVLAGALVAGAVVVPQVASAQSAPDLPPLTPQGLVAKALSSHVTSFSGQVRLTANLGLPDLSGLTGGQAAPAGPAGSLLSYLSGTHTAQVWYGGPGRARLAVPNGPNETDVVANGTSAWVWQSASFTATHLLIPAGATKAGGTAMTGTAAQAAGTTAMPTPAQVAKQLLSRIGPTTDVFVNDNAWVAGQPAYELGLSPAHSSQSLVADVLVAVDANNGMPLRVEVLARNATKPAFELGFTSVSFAQPAASNFTFTPPKGAKVTTHTIPAPAPTGSAPTGSAPTGSAPTVLGHGWDAIAVLPPGSLSEAMGSGPTPGSASSSTSPPGGNGGRSAGALRALLQGATPVTVNGAQAKLVTTSLVDALVLPDGQVLVGSVTPAALEAAASHLA